jgi:predicted amidophosphoribosyltransferase
MALCPSCFHNRPSFQHIASVFEREGPGRSFLNHLKTGRYFFLADDLAAWMALQIHQLQWPSFDLIVPIPSLSWSLFSSESCYALAQSLSHFMASPYKDLLKKRPVETLSDGDPRFSWKKREFLENSTVLMVMVEGKKRFFQAAAALLKQGFPRAVFGISLC